MADGDKTSSAYSGGYQAFYNSPTFSNFTVACGERYWRIHKLVLSANSEYFTRSCSGHFKVRLIGSHNTKSGSSWEAGSGGKHHHSQRGRGRGSGWHDLLPLPRHLRHCYLQG